MRPFASAADGILPPIIIMPPPPPRAPEGGATFKSTNPPTVALGLIRAGSLAGLISLWQAVELVILTPFYLATTAAALAAAGDLEGARDRLVEAIAVGDQTGMQFYDAEARRRLARLADDDTDVSVGLWSALEVARAQGARPFELRVALDLDARGEPGGRDALEVAVAGFRPDAELADLARARAIIAPSP